MSYDVIIVGARCAGGVLGTLLAKGGVRTLMLDTDKLPSDMIMSTHFIQPPGMDVLDEIGLGEAVRKVTPATQVARFRVGRADVYPRFPEGRAGCSARSMTDGSGDLRRFGGVPFYAVGATIRRHLAGEERISMTNRRISRSIASMASAKLVAVMTTAFVVWTAACRPASAPPPSPTPSQEEVALRCGGAGPGLHAVLAGVDNQYFTAATRQSIKLKPGVEVKEIKGKTITVALRNNNTTISCGCPAGCSNPVECVISESPPGSPITCSGDCTTAGGCCFGCGWVW